MKDTADILQVIFSNLFPDKILEWLKTEQLLRRDCEVGDNVQARNGIWCERYPDIGQEGTGRERVFQGDFFRVYQVLITSFREKVTRQKLSQLNIWNSGRFDQKIFVQNPRAPNDDGYQSPFGHSDEI